MRRPIVTLLLLLVGLGSALWWWQRSKQDESRHQATTLTVFCAAGLKTSIEAAAAQYEKESGCTIALQFGGTGTLLGQMALSKAGDLFIAADEGALRDAQSRKLINEVFPLVVQTPVIAVRPGNPKQVRGLSDLFREDLRLALANPEAASIGRTVKVILDEKWPALSQKAVAMKPTVMEIAADVQLGAIDAAIVWEAVAKQFKLETIRVPEFDAKPEPASAGLISTSTQPTAALRFARWLAAPEKGGAIFSSTGFKPAGGDSWTATPELTLYSGAVNRPALEPLLKAFADREGVKINTVFNGCGVLCATMKTMQPTSPALPDAYFACDLCFVPPVAEMFPEVSLLTETEIGIAVPKGNAKSIHSLDDLARQDLRLGISQQQQSTLGYMTDKLLARSQQSAAIRKNVVVEVPTGDFLINELRTRALDAAIVYKVNVIPQSAHLDFVPLDHQTAKAAQPFGIRAGSPSTHTAARLLSWLKQNPQAFEKAGFAWRGEEPPQESKKIEIPPWLK